MEVWKIIFFWVGSIFFLIGGVIACRFYRQAVYIIFGILLFSLADPDELSITFFGHVDYKMATRGVEIHLADICAIILCINILQCTPRKELVAFPPLTLPQMFFIFVAVLSWIAVKQNVPNPIAGEVSQLNPNGAVYPFALEQIFYLKLYPIFEILKLIRGFLIFWVAVNLSKDRNIIRIMYGVFSVLIIYFTIKSLILRYAFGVDRVTAGIGHYNNFNTFVGLMGAFLLPLAFSSKNFFTSAFIWFLVLSTIVCIILTISRSALFAFGIALLFGTPVMLLKFLNSKNIIFLLFGLLAMVGLLAKAEKTLTERFVYQNPTEKSLLNRELLNNEAKTMARDFPLGVGLGNFSAWSILRYSALTNAELGNFAHNSFYLTLAETGYLGLLAFLIFWLRYAQLGMIAFLHRIFGDDIFDLSVIMGANLAILFLLPQLWFQFTYRATAVYLLVHVILGVGVRQYLLAIAAQRLATADRTAKQRSALVS